MEEFTHRFDDTKIPVEKDYPPENGFLEIHAMIWDSKNDGATFYEENIQYKDSFLYQTMSQIPYINQTSNSSRGYVVYNDQPCVENYRAKWKPSWCAHVKGIEWDPRNKDAKTAHAKGMMAFDQDGGFWITHSVPGFPRNSTLFDGWYFAWAERKFAQAFMCMSMSTDTLNSVAEGMSISHPYVQEYDIPSSIKPHVYKIYDWVKEDYYADGNSTQVVKTVGGTDIHIIEHYDNPHTDLWDDLVAPYLKTNLHVETFCQASRDCCICHNICKFV